MVKLESRELNMIQLAYWYIAANTVIDEIAFTGTLLHYSRLNQRNEKLLFPAPQEIN
jgi:hypothetical protein